MGVQTSRESPLSFGLGVQQSLSLSCYDLFLLALLWSAPLLMICLKPARPRFSSRRPLMKIVELFPSFMAIKKLLSPLPLRGNNPETMPVHFSKVQKHLLGLTLDDLDRPVLRP